jgi:hypothetical protein
MLKRTEASSLIPAVVLLLALIPGLSAPARHTEGLNTVSRVRIPEASSRTSSAISTAITTQNNLQARVRARAALDQLPLSFIKNHGQLAGAVDYYVQGRDKTIYFTPEGLTFALTEWKHETAPSSANPSLALAHDAGERTREQDLHARRWIVKLDFVGANPRVQLVGRERSDAKLSYFRGSGDQWHIDVPVYHGMLYRDLWPDIDLFFFGTVHELKYEFIVHPGGDPAQIRLAYRGAERLTLNDAGQLEVTTPVGGFTDDTPMAYQEIDGQRVRVDVGYDFASSTRPVPSATHSSRFSYAVGRYDPNRPLVIDPAVLIYSGYIGGSGADTSSGIAVGTDGAAYVVGITVSPESENFPVTVGPDPSYNGGDRDAFVAKVKPDGTGLDYCGYLGGSLSDRGRGIAVDGEGAAYIAGYTESSESEGFPVAVGPDLVYNGGDHDGFIAKVNPEGTGLAYCGYIGGGMTDYALDTAVDSAGDLYVVGVTGSSETQGFPVTAGPDLSYNGGHSDVFVAKLEGDGTGMRYCGYVGGTAGEWTESIALDGAGAVYMMGLTGSSESDGFPVLLGPDLSYNGGDQDAFVAKVRADGTALDYCGYIGGSDETYDYGVGIAVDRAGAAYVVGRTWSSESESFPVVVGPDLSYNGFQDGFVAKVKPDGTGLDYCGYIGGSGGEVAADVAVDETGAAYVVGSTGSSESQGFPVVGGPDLTYNGADHDAFVAKVEPDGTGLCYCGYIGGEASETGYDIALDGAGAAYVTGYTGSSESQGFPVVGGPDLTYNGADYDAFVVKVSADEAPDAIPPAPINDLSATSGGPAGTVNLSWTAPGDDGNTGTATTYIVRYADTPITTPFGWIGATNVSGEPTPKPAGSSEQMVVSGLTSGETYYFAIRALDEAGNESDLSNNPSAVASDAPDLGFRPNPNGYRFENRRLWRNWEMFEQFFGSNRVTHSDGSRCAAAERFFQDNYLHAGNRWSCLGFSLTSLLSYLDWSQPDAGPFAIDHYERLYDQQMSAQLTNPIAYYSGVQTAQQWGNQYTSWIGTCDTEPDRMIASIREGIEDENPLLLTLNTQLQGNGGTTIWHTVAPYLVDELSPTNVDIYVYDSEAHGQERVVSFVDIGAGWRWEYTFLGSLGRAGRVNGTCTDMYPYRVETSLDQGDPPTDWCQDSARMSANSSETTALTHRMLATLPAEGDGIVRDRFGRRLGWVDGQFISEIPDAHYVPQTLGAPSLSFRAFYVPEDEYTVVVSNSPDETFAYTLFGDGCFVEMSGHLQSAGSDASLLVDPDLKRATVIGMENLASFRLAIDNESPAESRVATLAGSPLWGTGDLEASFDGDHVTLSRAPGDVEYNLMLRKSRGQLFVSEPLNVESNDTHALSPVSWDDLSSTSVILEIDENSDGTVDETQVLENKAKRVYLPLVIRNH